VNIECLEVTIECLEEYLLMELVDIVYTHSLTLGAS